MTQTATKTQQGAKFASFAIERTLKAPPRRVFAAWATAEGKAKWFAGTAGQWVEKVREFNFREGGEDRLVGEWQAAPAGDFRKGSTSDFHSRYWEIIPDQRIVYTYEMRLDGVRISVSLATIELRPEGSGTHMKVTEQGSFLVPFDPGGDDNASREHGTNQLIDKLVRSVDGS